MTVSSPGKAAELKKAFKDGDYKMPHREKIQSSPPLPLNPYFDVKVLRYQSTYPCRGKITKAGQSLSEEGSASHTCLEGYEHHLHIFPVLVNGFK